jgi:hypothetical protein
MPRKTEFTKRKGKDKAKEHRQKCGKYDGKATRRALAYLSRSCPTGPLHGLGREDRLGSAPLDINLRDSLRGYF